MFSIVPLIFLSPSVILIAAAVIPAVALLIYVYRMDRLEKEPWPIIWRLGLFGAISTALAQVTESIGTAALPYFAHPGGKAYYLILCYIVIGLSEEGFKYLILKLRTWRSPEFNCRFDGVVYACAVSLGFSLWENILYVLSYGMGTAIVRAVTAIPGHACFGVFMGTWYGLAKRASLRGQEERSRLFRLFAVLIPVLLHGIYDFVAASGVAGVSWLFLPFVTVMFLASYLLVRIMSRRERYMR
jgi:RsiW-degrading membrane proteinase PrsW (M82 family)